MDLFFKCTAAKVDGQLEVVEALIKFHEQFFSIGPCSENVISESHVKEGFQEARMRRHYSRSAWRIWHMT